MTLDKVKIIFRNEGTKMQRYSVLEKAKEYFANLGIKSQLHKDFSDIISIKSIASQRQGEYPFGARCAEALDLALEMGKRYGFQTENHDYYCGSILYGDSEDEIGLVVHLDVVPEGNGWSGNPFTLKIDQDLYIGRGTLDDKGPFIACLYALRFLKDHNISLPFTVRLILGSDEEVGSTDLEYYAKIKTPPAFSFTPDARFPVCIGEKGILQVDIKLGGLPAEIQDISGGEASNAVPDTATATVWDSDITRDRFKDNKRISVVRIDEKRIKVTARGESAHASMPENGVNAIGLLVDFLLDHGYIKNNRNAFSFLSEACNEYKGETLGIARTDEDFGYLTCIGGRLRVENGILVQNFNIRYIPDVTHDKIFNAIKDTLVPKGFYVSEGMFSEGYTLPKADKRVRALMDAYREITGRQDLPFTMGGGTYARWLANTVAFGPAIDSERLRLGATRGDAHQADEYISHKELESTFLIYIKSVINLAREGL